MDEDYPVEPQFLRFSSNDDFGSAEWKADMQSLEVLGTDMGESSPPIQPTRLQWKAFWLLLDHANVWNWQPTYTPAGELSCDDHQWALEVSRDGRYIHTCGHEAYPGTPEKQYEEGSPYDVLRTAMEILISANPGSGVALEKELLAEPASFDFTYWCDGWEGMGINLRWRKNGAGLEWQHVSSPETIWRRLPAPSGITWKAFRLLLDRARIWSWKPGYASVSTAHLGWSFEASVSGRHIRTSGGDTYPQAEEGSGCLPGSPFDILLTALGLLAGQDILALRMPGERGRQSGGWKPVD